MTLAGDMTLGGEAGTEHAAQRPSWTVLPSRQLVGCVCLPCWIAQRGHTSSSATTAAGASTARLGHSSRATVPTFCSTHEVSTRWCRRAVSVSSCSAVGLRLTNEHERRRESCRKRSTAALLPDRSRFGVMGFASGRDTTVAAMLPQVSLQHDPKISPKFGAPLNYKKTKPVAPTTFDLTQCEQLAAVGV